MGSWSTRRPRVAAADPWCSGNLPSSRILPAPSLGSLVCGLWSAVFGQWSLVSGLWFFGLWSLLSGLWPLVSGLGSLVSGLWPLVSGLWSLVSLSLSLGLLVVGLSVYSMHLATRVHGAANARRAQAASVFLRQSHGRSGFAAGAMAWREAGRFSAREQLKAWALREAWRQNNEGSHGMLTWIAEKLVKIGGCRDVPARLEALCSADGGKLRK